MRKLFLLSLMIIFPLICFAQHPPAKTNETKIVVGTFGELVVNFSSVWSFDVVLDSGVKIQFYILGTTFIDAKGNINKAYPPVEKGERVEVKYLTTEDGNRAIAVRCLD